MSTERSRRCELAKLVSDHVFRHEHFRELTANCESGTCADKVGHDLCSLVTTS